MVIGSGYVGIGYVIASQSLAINPVVGCGQKTPSNWTVDDDWESFEPWPDSEERVDISRDLMLPISNAFL